jgi:hexokinase
MSGHSSIERFLARNRVVTGRLDLQKYCGAFLAEMSRGLQERPSTLPMIPTYIETVREVFRGERVIALDAGGTNFRAAVVSFDPEGKPVIEDLARHAMPGADGEIDREEFFAALARLVLPVARRAGAIGFCFSYAVEMQADKDGRLLYFTKEIKARGVEGEHIGRGLARALVAAGAQAPSRIVLLNDTVATLLAGRNAQPGRRFDDFVGVVCGTGINAAYVEGNSQIRKVPGLDPSGSQIVNTESGSFGKGAYGPVDDGFDASTATPGKYRHEKTISGAYLGALCLFGAQQAAREGCFAADTASGVARIPSLSTRELNDFLLYPDTADNPLAAISRRAPAEDGQALYRLCDAFVERAAAMVAVNLAAIVLKTGKGRDPRYPVCITVDGTTFWQLRSFRSRVESRMRSLLAGANERAWEITSVDDAPLLGAAIAALTN